MESWCDVGDHSRYHQIMDFWFDVDEHSRYRQKIEFWFDENSRCRQNIESWCDAEGKPRRCWLNVNNMKRNDGFNATGIKQSWYWDCGGGAVIA